MMKVLMIMEQCNPEWASVPLVAYNFYAGLREKAEVTLVTHARNRSALEKIRGPHRIEYVGESKLTTAYYALIEKWTTSGNVNWPLQHALAFPVYAEFDFKVFRHWHKRVAEGEFDAVHVMTPMIPRYPSRMVRFCGRRGIPCVFGPVNGGVPFPDGFEATARREFAHLNFLRIFSRLLPGYMDTYRKAPLVLSGSTYTRDMLLEVTPLSPDRVSLFYENGVSDAAFFPPVRRDRDRFQLLFTGRLVPYKGADMLLDAMARLPATLRAKTELLVVGDGPELQNLKVQSAQNGLDGCVIFTGRVPQPEVARYCRESDLFCFPSIREFGGAVVMEAMACGVPCVVVDNGGIGEYVQPDNGVKIEPRSREYIVEELARAIEELLGDAQRRFGLACKAYEDAQQFRWSAKADRMLQFFGEAGARL